MIKGLTKNLKNWEDKGFMTVANREEIKIIVARLCERKAQTSLKWVEGRAGTRRQRKS
jgi:ribonuclease HI